MVIYKTTNLVNGKIYVGRDSHNDFTYLGSGVRLEAAVTKYGRDNFKREVLEYCTLETIYDREIYWIAALQACEERIGYNVSPGGRDGYQFGHRIWKGRKHSEAALAKMRARKPSESTLSLLYMNAPRGENHVGFAGRHHSEGTRAMLRSKVGVMVRSLQAIKNQAQAMKRPEVREACAAKARGRHASAATREKMRLAHLGCKRRMAA